MKKWKTLSSTPVVHDRWLKLNAERCQLPDDRVIEPWYVMQESDWVQVFAQAEDGRVLLVRQYRHAAGVECAELPGGAIDEGESALAAARRELLEETGYTATTWQNIGRMYANPARQNNAIHIFYASGLLQATGQTLDVSEAIAFEFASIGQVQEMITAGEFSQALHIAAFYRCLHALAAAPGK